MPIFYFFSCTAICHICLTYQLFSCLASVCLFLDILDVVSCDQFAFEVMKLASGFFFFILKNKTEGEAEEEKGQQASCLRQDEQAGPETEELELMEIERVGDQTDPGREEQTDLEKENEVATTATSSVMCLI